MASCVIENESDLKTNWSVYLDNFNEQTNEISALESFFERTENFEILQQASVDLGQLNSLQFKIQVNAKKEMLKTEIWLPIQYSCIETDDNEAQTASAAAATSVQSEQEKKAKFERSISGKTAHTTLNCSYLPYLLMDVTLPCTYPSDSKPIYQIKCIWLNMSQMNQVCTKLDEIWDDNYKMPVLFTWTDWIQNSLIEYLDIFHEPNKIFITPLDYEYIQNNNNKNINTISLFVSVDDLLFQFLRHNHIEDLKQFRNTLQSCMICFDEKFGKEFFRLNDCKHHFCADCLTSMCQIHVKEGTIQLLKCPHNECKEFVPIEIMQQVLNNEEFDRWQRLLLQRTLDQMADIIYCPKCSIPIIIDQNNTHSFCLNCNLDYCKLCKAQWHPGECLTEEMKVEQKVKSLNLNVKDLLQMTDQEIRQRFHSNSNLVLNVKKEAVTASEKDLNNELLKKFVRCPKCQSPIEKFEGCNKVVCICGTILCYVCGKIIEGYEHFNAAGSKCNLWSVQTVNRVPVRPQHEAQRALERVLAVAPEQRRNTANCPCCGQINLKVEKNNHIKCWLCSTNFCFCCKKRIVGIITNHFRAGSECKQHSDSTQGVDDKPSSKKKNSSQKNDLNELEDNDDDE